jgi:hypothetical protein
VRYLRLFADDLVVGLTWPGIVVLAIFLAATLAGGFLVGLRGFAVNLLAGVVGLIVAIIAGILFIDRLPDRGRHRAWSQIRQHTLESIEMHAISFAACCALSLGEVLPLELLHSDDPSPAVKTGWVLGVAERIRATEPENMPNDMILKAARNDLGQIVGPLTQTVISLSSDTTLIHRLAKLRREANHAVLLLIQEKAKDPRVEAPDRSAWRAIANTLDAAADVLSHTANADITRTPA